MANKFEIPFSPPDIGEEEIAEVIDTLKSGWITTGPKTKEFEARLAQYCNTDRVVCLNSATASLELTLRILGIGPGDEVITSAYTYTASASPIDHVGAKIVMVDTQEDSFEMDYQQLGDAITERTKAIIPIDLAGNICDYDRIFEVIEERKHLFKAGNEIQDLYGRPIVIADSAHGLGASRDNMMAGEIADFTTFSFHAVKNLTTAEGGAVTWRNVPGLDNDEIYRQYQLLSLHGQSKDAFNKKEVGNWEYDIMAPSYKANMTDISAAIGLAQLKRYPDLLKRRQEIIGKYEKAFADLPVKLLNYEDDNHRSSGHLYLIRVNGIDEETRNEIIVELAKRGVSSNVHYKPLPLLTAYRNLGFDIKDYPNSYGLYRNEISLPLYSMLTDEEVDYIAENFIEVVNKFAG